MIFGSPIANLCLCRDLQSLDAWISLVLLNSSSLKTIRRNGRIWLSDLDRSHGPEWDESDEGSTRSRSCGVFAHSSRSWQRGNFRLYLVPEDGPARWNSMYLLD